LAEIKAISIPAKNAEIRMLMMMINKLLISNNN
jgi:hypothetical protein